MYGNLRTAYLILKVAVSEFEDGESIKNESIAMAADNVEMMIETMAIINKTFFF